MTTLEDIEELEDSGWGASEILTEIEIRRGITRSQAADWWHSLVANKENSHP